MTPTHNGHIRRKIYNKHFTKHIRSDCCVLSKKVLQTIFRVIYRVERAGLPDRFPYLWNVLFFLKSYLPSFVPIRSLIFAESTPYYRLGRMNVGWRNTQFFRCNLEKLDKQEYTPKFSSSARAINFCWLRCYVWGKCWANVFS